MSVIFRLALLGTVCIALGGCITSGGGTSSHVDAQLAKHGV